MNVYETRPGHEFCTLDEAVGLEDCVDLYTSLGGEVGVRQGVWYLSGGAPVQEFGWKLHVSSTLAGWESIIEALACLSRQKVTVKFLRSTRILGFVNSKWWPPDSSGKFGVAYPRDDDSFRMISDFLSKELRGLDGPSILTDMNVNDRSPVYFRWGRHRASPVIGWDGQPQNFPAVGPAGAHWSDSRRIGFDHPGWVEMPIPPAESHHENPLADYKVSMILNRSSAGSVYLAKANWGQIVALKEGRRHIEIGPGGEDAFDRVHREARTLKLLGGYGHSPEVIDSFNVYSHAFVVTNLVEGETLHSWLTRNHPAAYPIGFKNSEVFLKSASELLSSLRVCLEKLRGAGLAHGDVSPRNIMVGRDGSVTLIDFESARALTECWDSRWRTPGFSPMAGEVSSSYTYGELDNFSESRIAEYVHCPCIALREIDSSAYSTLLASTLVQLHNSVSETLYKDHAGELRELFNDSLNYVASASKAVIQGRSGLAPEGLSGGSSSLYHGLAGMALVSHLDRRRYEAGEAAWPEETFNPPSQNGPSLEFGSAGLAIASAGLMKFDQAKSQIYEAMDSLRHLPPAYGYSNGFVGVLSALAEVAILSGDPSLSPVVEREIDRLAGQWEGQTDLPWSPRDLSVDSGVAGLLFVVARCNGLCPSRRLVALMRSLLGHIKQNLRCVSTSLRGAPALVVESDGAGWRPYVRDGGAGVLNAVVSALMSHGELVDEYAPLASALALGASPTLVLSNGLMRGLAGNAASVANYLNSPFGREDQPARIALGCMTESLLAGRVNASTGRLLTSGSYPRVAADLASGAAGVAVAVKIILGSIEGSATNSPKAVMLAGLPIS